MPKTKTYLVTVAGELKYCEPRYVTLSKIVKTNDPECPIIFSDFVV